MGAKVVGVHGAFHELWGPHQVKARWLPALRDGLWLAESGIAEADLAIAFYGDLFRHDPVTSPAPQTVEEALAQHDLGHLLEGAAAQQVLVGLQQAFGQALAVRLFDTIARYASEPGLRAAVAQRLEAQISADTRVLVAHSLGSIIAYEALCAHPEWGVRTFVTLGSPLGAPRVVAALRPEPVDGVGVWPPGIETWVNVAALGDPVAVQPRLASVFGAQVHDEHVDNGHRAHDPEPYLDAAVTGRALAAALAAD